jgi:hypothetical protein
MPQRWNALRVGDEDWTRRINVVIQREPIEIKPAATGLGNEKWVTLITKCGRPACAQWHFRLLLLGGKHA